MSPTPQALALLGGPEPWPLAGHVRGALQGAACSVSWVGRIGAAQGPEQAWRLSRRLERALTAGGPAEGDRRRVLSVMWARLEPLLPAEDVVLLLASVDASGAALSAVGVGRLYGSLDGALRPWLAPPHPLLGPPGLQEEPPGGLVVQALPDWLFAQVDGPDLDGTPVEQIFARCGVHG